MRSASNPQLAQGFDCSPLRIGIALDIPLRRRERGMAGELLDIAEAATMCDDSLGKLGNKRPAAAMARRALETEAIIQPMKPHRDHELRAMLPGGSSRRSAMATLV